MYKFCFFQLILFSVFQTSSIAQCPVPKIVSPNGFEELIAGETFNVNYYYTDDYFFNPIEEYIDFYYTINNGNEWIFVNSIKVDSTLVAADSLLSFEWIVPNTLSDRCKIKLVKFDTWCWDESDNIFNIIQPTSNKNSLIEELKIYPNPIAIGNELFIDNVPNGYSRMIIYDLNGSVIFNTSIHNMIDIDPHQFKKGLYFLTLQGIKEIISIKLIIE